jgi:hypothetical protein
MSSTRSWSARRTSGTRIRRCTPDGVLAQELNKARFLEGSALFLSTPGLREEFASRFGPESGPTASAA